MKRILKGITSRKIAVATNILVQFLIIFVLIAYFDNVFVYYYAITSAIAILFGIILINKNMNSGYKIAWLLLIIFFPAFGITLFLLLEGSWYTRKTKRKMLSITERIKDGLCERGEIEFDDTYACKQSRYIEDFSYSPPVKNTRSKYFSCGEDYFTALLTELKTAKKSIYVEYFIIKESRMWEEINTVPPAFRRS